MLPTVGCLARWLHTIFPNYWMLAVMRRRKSFVTSNLLHFCFSISLLFMCFHITLCLVSCARKKISAAPTQPATIPQENKNKVEENKKDEEDIKKVEGKKNEEQKKMDKNSSKKEDEKKSKEEKENRETERKEKIEKVEDKKEADRRNETENPIVTPVSDDDEPPAGTQKKEELAADVTQIEKKECPGQYFNVKPNADN